MRILHNLVNQKGRTRRIVYALVEFAVVVSFPFLFFGCGQGGCDFNCGPTEYRFYFEMENDSQIIKSVYYPSTGVKEDVNYGTANWRLDFSNQLNTAIIETDGGFDTVVYQAKLSKPRYVNGETFVVLETVDIPTHTFSNVYLTETSDSYYYGYDNTVNVKLMLVP